MTDLLVDVDAHAQPQHRLDLVGELQRVFQLEARADGRRVEEDGREVLGCRVILVLLDALAQLLDERVTRVQLQRALLVLVVPARREEIQDLWFYHNLETNCIRC